MQNHGNTPDRSAMPDDVTPDSGFSGNLSFGVTLGHTVRGEDPVFQLSDDRFRHTAVVGRTGSGKSNLMHRMERQDIRNGAGCFILAAHEEDALYPLSCVPEHRLADVVFIDASNPEYLPRMNPLDIDVSDPLAVSKAVSDVLELLTAGSHYDWYGPRFEQMLRNGLGLILEPDYPFPREIAELNRLFTDPDHVKEALRHCTDKAVYDQWTKVEPGARKSSDYGEVVQWFLAKTAPFVNDRVLRHVFGAGRSTVSVQAVVDAGGILVAYVPESRIGASAANAINNYLVRQLRDAVLNRSTGAGHGWTGLSYDLLEDGRDLGGASPFVVYVDEFARFAGVDFERLLAESRKRGVAIVLGFQTLSQTRALDIRTGQVGALEEAILGNVGSFVCFPMGERDTAILSRQLDVDEERLRRIRRYQPLVRLSVGNQPTEPFALGIDPQKRPANPTAPRRLALHHVLAGDWLPIEGATSEAFFGAVLDDALAVSGAEDGFATVYQYADRESHLLALSASRSEAEARSVDGHATEVVAAVRDDRVVWLLLVPRDEAADGEPGPRAEHGAVDAVAIGGAAAESSLHQMSYRQMPRPVMGHAFRYRDKDYNTITEYRRDVAEREAVDGIETIWVYHVDDMVIRDVTLKEWREEKDRRVGERISAQLTPKQLEEFAMLDDSGADLAPWFEENVPNFMELVDEVEHEMDAARVVG